MIHYTVTFRTSTNVLEPRWGTFEVRTMDIYIHPCVPGSVHVFFWPDNGSVYIDDPRRVMLKPYPPEPSPDVDYSISIRPAINALTWGGDPA